MAKFVQTKDLWGDPKTRSVIHAICEKALYFQCSEMD
jgi:hypothetical protein